MMLLLNTLVALMVTSVKAVKYSREQFDDYSGEQVRPYSFHYEVDAPYHETWHDRTEKSSGSSTEGQFRVALPDHRLQTVRYQATRERGFLADVQFEQHPDFKTLRGRIGKAPAIGESIVPAQKTTKDTVHSLEVEKKPLSSRVATGTVSFGSRNKASSTSIVTKRPIHRIQPKGRPSVHRLSRPIASRPAVDLAHSTVTTSPLSAFVSIAALDHENKKHISGSRPNPAKSPIVRPSKPFSSSFIPRGRKVASISSGKGSSSRPLRNKQNQLQTKPLDATSEIFREQDRLSKPRPLFGDRKPTSGSRKVSRLRIGANKKQPEAVLDDTPSANEIPVSHEPEKKPVEIVTPPATQDENFSVVGRKDRYYIRDDVMESVRARLRGIVHSK